jgi:hypothetical protein
VEADRMKTFNHAFGFRMAAAAFAVAALALPAILAWAGFLDSPGTGNCQSPTAAFASLLTTVALSGVLATAALGMSAVAFALVPPPRPVVCKLELALCSFPLVLALVCFVALYLVFTAG